MAAGYLVSKKARFLYTSDPARTFETEAGYRIWLHDIWLARRLGLFLPVIQLGLLKQRPEMNISKMHLDYFCEQKLCSKELNLYFSL